MATNPSPVSSATDSLYSSGGSDLDILNGLSELPDDGGKSSPAVADAPGTGAVEAAPEGTGVEPEWLGTAPEELKGMLSQQNLSAAAKTWLKQTYEELNGLKASPLTAKETLQELSEIAPGGIQDLRDMRDNAQKFAVEREQFGSNDPEQQSELLGSLLQDNPDAFVGLTNVGLDMLKQTLRDDYTAIAGRLTAEHLETVTNGKFATFFDSLEQMADEYSKLADSNPEAAAKIANKLAGMALTSGGWWKDSKKDLGFGVDPKTATAPRNPVTNRNAPDDREVTYALRDASYFEEKLGSRHDTAINPLITSALTKDLEVRGMQLSDHWKGQVQKAVASAIVENLKNDREFQALMNRYYHRGAPNDPRKWDKSDNVSKILINAAMNKAQKLIPGLMKNALGRLAELNPGKKAPIAAGTGARGGGGTSPAGKGSSVIAEDDFKNPNVSDADILNKIAGIA